MSLQLKVKLLDPQAKAPTKNHYNDAGWDLYALNDVEIRPGETKKIETGIAIELPLINDKITVGLIWDRSGLGSKGITKLAGVIDYQYRGPVMVCLHNANTFSLLNALHDFFCLKWLKLEKYKERKQLFPDSTYHIKAGDRIAQLLIQEVIPVDLVVVEELSDTARADKGFASSGR